MNIQKIGQYFAVFILITFVLSLFTALLYAPQQNPLDTSTTLALKAFDGVGLINAKVVNVTNKALVQCNATDAKTIIENIQGVDKERFFALSSDIFSFTVTEEAAFSKINSALSTQCDLKVLREATLRITDEVIAMRSQSTNEEKNFTQRSLQALQGLGGVVRGFVYSDTRIGDEVLAAMLATSPDGLYFSEATIQEQPRAPKLSFVNEVISARILNTTDSLVAMNDVPWANRVLNATVLSEQYNLSISYSSQDYFIVKNTNGSAFNFSFVVQANKQGNDTLVDVAADFTDQALVRSSFANYTLDFPNSTMTITSDESGIPAVQTAFPSARVYRIVILQALNSSVAFDTPFQALVHPSVVSGENVTVRLTAILQGGSIVQAQAIED